MQDAAVAQTFNDALWAIYAETKLLPLNLIHSAGMSPKDFGITIRE
jgi:hypothetical protein